MVEVIEMPKLSDTMEAGRIVAWHKKVGDRVKAGELLAEIQTDKATVDFESYFDGVLLYIGVREGEEVPIGTLIAIIGEEGEDITPILAKFQNKQSQSRRGQEDSPAPVEKEQVTEERVNLQKQVVVEEVPVGKENGRIKASPLARRLAKEHGIPLELLHGSGPGGRIIKRDIEMALKEGVPHAAPLPPAAGEEEYEVVPLTQMRKTIAKRLSESKFTAPHFYLTMEIDMEEAAKLRNTLNAMAETKISFNDLIIKAVAVALRRHPYVNASWHEDHIRLHKRVHIGVAVALPQGLVVPVVRDADRKGLEEIARETKELAEKARNDRLSLKEIQGSTFSISNLGMFGIDEFTAIINPPNVCILAVGQIKEVVVPQDGELVIRKRMKVTLSCDHRVVDGATGAQFLQTVKNLLENPLTMLL